MHNKSRWDCGLPHLPLLAQRNATRWRVNLRDLQLSVVPCHLHFACNGAHALDGRGRLWQRRRLALEVTHPPPVRPQHNSLARRSTKPSHRRLTLKHIAMVFKDPGQVGVKRQQRRRWLLKKPDARSVFQDQKKKGHASNHQIADSHEFLRHVA